MYKSIQSLCRACMRKCKSRHVSLEDTFPFKLESIMYVKAYTICTQLEAQLGLDRLPVWLCQSCSRDLQYAYEFWCMARESEVKLRDQLGSMKQDVVRAATPSEFEIPDNNEAVAYMRADADLMDVCSSRQVKCEKDPLEASDSENDMKPIIGSSTDRVDSSVGTPAPPDLYDSDDDKPLKELISHSDGDLTKASDDDDEFRADENNEGEKVIDPMFSPEANIFPKGRHKCAICDQTYFTSIGLKAHMEVHLAKSAITKKKRVRNKQRQKSKTAKELENFVLEFPGNTNFNETTVETPLPTECGVTKNVAKMRKTKVPKPKRMFPCHVCGKHMISASKLRYHMVMHTGEKDYLCTMCPKAYSTIYALKHHIRTHTGERPYECKFCGDRFLRPTTLKSHQRRHTGERPYGCDICGKRFIQHSSMTTHMKLNHMDKTIQCPHCDKKYARQTDLNTHLLSHTGDKPYPCQLCPSRFVRQANLNKHMNQQHSERVNGSIAAGASSMTKANKRSIAKVHSVKSKEYGRLIENVNNQVNDINIWDRNAIEANHINLSTKNGLIEDVNVGFAENNSDFMSTPAVHGARDLPPQYLIDKRTSEQSTQHLAAISFVQMDNDDFMHWNWPTNN